MFNFCVMTFLSSGKSRLQIFCLSRRRAWLSQIPAWINYRRQVFFVVTCGPARESPSSVNNYAFVTMNFVRLALRVAGWQAFVYSSSTKTCFASSFIWGSALYQVDEKAQKPECVQIFLLISPLLCSLSFRALRHFYPITSHIKKK